MIFYGKNDGDKKIIFEEFFKNNEIHFFDKPKLDELLEIKKWIFLKPESRYKVIFIKKADFISKEASNFLLKIIEESPEYARWVISTDSLNVLGALKSRSFLIPFTEEEKNLDALEENLFGILKSSLYCNAYKYLSDIKKAEYSEEELKEKYLDICNVLIKFYANNSKKLHLIQKTKNVIVKNIRSETILKTLFIQVL
jgi:DNA polymerase III delta prime subunit